MAKRIVTCSTPTDAAKLREFVMKRPSVYGVTGPAYLEQLPQDKPVSIEIRGVSYAVIDDAVRASGIKVS